MNRLLALFAALLFTTFVASAETVERRVVMSGTRYETPYFIKTGAQTGPTIVVIGGLHGDETVGYLAARKIRQWKVTRGRLIVMPDAHREAIRRNTRGFPGNMNNMFPGKADGNDMERLAFEIWTVIRQSQPDLLLTLHESRDFHANDPARYGQTFCFDFPELVPRFQTAMNRANLSIKPAKHKFLIFVKPFPSCPTYQAWSQLKVPATSIETSRTLPLETRVRYQLLATQAFFDEWDLGYQQSDVPSTPKAATSAQIKEVRPRGAVKIAEITPQNTALPARATAVSTEMVESKTPTQQRTPFSWIVWVAPVFGAALGWLGWSVWQTKVAG